MPIWYLLTFLFIGFLLIALAIPLIRGKVKPNSWYGFRTPKTQSDPLIWTKANAFAGKGLLIVGLLTIGVAIVLYYIPSITEDFYAIVLSAILMIGVLLVFFFGWRYAKEL